MKTPRIAPAPVEKLLWSISETARRLTFDRGAVAGMVRRGELPIVPKRQKDGTLSRVHKGIPVAAVQAWIEKNQVFGAEQLRAVLDGRRSA